MLFVSCPWMHGEQAALSFASVDFDRLLHDWKKAASSIQEIDRRQTELSEEIKVRRQDVAQKEQQSRQLAKQIEEVGGEMRANDFLKQDFMRKHQAFQAAALEQARWEKETLATLSQERIRTVNALLLEIQDALKRSETVSRFTMVINLNAGMPGQLPVFLHLAPGQVTDITGELLAELQAEAPPATAR
ncbi:MAG: hypothetical protein RIS79_226 [Verrucomicrobiota bacterium]|jgi:DNA repair exonuclease SbcCD ATPase subunit